jgi:uncharacterized membrane protein
MRLTYMNQSSVGHWLYAIGFLGLGVLSFIFDDYAMNWQPVPPSFPAHDAMAYVSAFLLSASGVGLLLHRTRIYAAVLLTAFIGLWLLVLRVPPLVADFFSAINWLGFAETLEMMTGGWVLAATLIRLTPDASASPRLAWIAKPSSLKWAILLFGASLPLIGLSHFVYAKETAQMIPQWFPQRLGLAYLTGAGHAAAGIAILLNVLPRLAATMEACMMGCFVLFLHIPGVVAEPTSRFQWTMMFVAISITGAAAIVAHQLTQLSAQSERTVSDPNAA